MTPKIIGRRLFTDGVTRPVYQDDRGQFIVEDGVGKALLRIICPVH